MTRDLLLAAFGACSALGCAPDPATAAESTSDPTTSASSVDSSTSSGTVSSESGTDDTPVAALAGGAEKGPLL